MRYKLLVYYTNVMEDPYKRQEEQALVTPGASEGMKRNFIHKKRAPEQGCYGSRNCEGISNHLNMVNRFPKNLAPFPGYPL